MKRAGCRAANIALQYLVGASWQVSKLVAKLGQVASTHKLLPVRLFAKLQIATQSLGEVRISPDLFA